MPNLVAVKLCQTIKTLSNPAADLLNSLFLFFLWQVAYLTRGELDRSWGVLDSLSRSRSLHRLSDWVLRARLYVQLKRGRTEEATKDIRDNLSSSLEGK